MLRLPFPHSQSTTALQPCCCTSPRYHRPMTSVILGHQRSLGWIVSTTRARVGGKLCRSDRRARSPSRSCVNGSRASVSPFGSRSARLAPMGWCVPGENSASEQRELRVHRDDGHGDARADRHRRCRRRTSGIDDERRPAVTRIRRALQAIGPACRAAYLRRKRRV